MSLTDYKMKFLTVARAQGASQEASEGQFLWLMPGYTVNHAGVEVRDAFDTTQDQMGKDNKRAFADLVCVMPNNRLTNLTKRSKLKHF